MSYGDFNAQIKDRGAQAIERLAESKVTQFVFEGKLWSCADKVRPTMTTELADGYEMKYCLELYCQPVAQPVA